MGRVYNGLVRRLAVPGLEDTQCGFKCFKRGPATDLFDRQTMDGFAFDVELLYLARQQELTVRETGVDWYYRERSTVRPLLGLTGDDPGPAADQVATPESLKLSA